MMTPQIERRVDSKELYEVKSIAEKALTLINVHEKVCAERYGELKSTGEKVANALKYVHVGMGMVIALQFLVGLYVMLHH